MSAGAVFDLLGLVGVALYLVAYALLQARVLHGSGYAYTLMNLAAATCVLASLSVAFNLSSALIQTSWIVISLVGLGLTFTRNRRARFTGEERALLDSQFPELSRPAARTFLDRGTWSDLDPGAVLTEEGTPVSHLFYIAEGRADVVSAGRAVGHVTGELVGEMNVLTRAPASATVRVSAPSRVFSIPAETLAEATRRDPDLRMVLEAGMGRSTRDKLARANRLLAGDPVT